MIFENCPYELIDEAFKNLYPGKNYIAQYADELTDPDGKNVLGVIIYPDDGSLPVIQINTLVEIYRSTEIFIHELAHLANGKGGEDEHHKDEHGESFMMHYNAIFDECERLQDGCVGKVEERE